MEKTAFIIIIIIFFILTGYNWYYFSSIRRLIIKKNEVTDKENFYRLDAKIELQKYLVLGLISIASFLGINECSDINTDLKQLDSLENRLNTIKFEYDVLKNENDSLFKELNKFDTSLANSRNDLNSLNNKINEATRRIPESNLRVISKLLAKVYLEVIVTRGHWDERTYTIEEIESEIEKINELLLSAGVYKTEIDKVIREAINDSLLIDKIKNFH